MNKHFGSFLFSISLRQVIREIDTPFSSRHNEYSDVYGELFSEKNSYEQAFNTESNIEKLILK